MEEQFETIRNKNELIRNISRLIDRHIYSNYTFWEGNYISYDLIFEERFNDKYSPENKIDFIEYLKEQAEKFSMNWEKGKDYLFEIYANALNNQLNNNE